MTLLTPAAFSSPVKHPDHFFIGGKWLAPLSNARLDVIVPSTERAFYIVAEAREVDINGAIAAARQAFDHRLWAPSRLGRASALLKRYRHGRSGEVNRVQAAWQAKFCSGQMT